jgi:RNA polymerase sigma-70 factor (sigma-E family)
MSARDAGFVEYVAARRPQLYRAACLLCGDPHRAEDVLQAALTKLYVAWPRAQRADSVDAYVRRILVNAHVDETRKPWRRETSVDEMSDRPVRAPVGVEESDALWAALRALPAGQRRVVVLRHYLGLSVDETAADLGISPGTVKSQTSEALRSLRTVLTPAGSPTTGDER